MKKTSNIRFGFFLQRAVIITIIAAIIEIPIVYLFATNMDADAPAITTASIQPGNRSNIIKQPTLNSQPNLIASNKENISTSSPEPIAASFIAISNPTMPATTTTLPAKATKPAAKLILSDAQLMKIADQVLTERSKLNAASTCIKVRKTTNSNVSNAFVIAEKLKAKGFAISGREETTAAIKGIKISNNGPCMTITIGTMKP